VPLSGGILLEAAPHQPQPPAPPDTLIIHPPVIDAAGFQAVVRERESERERLGGAGCGVWVSYPCELS